MFNENKKHREEKLFDFHKNFLTQKHREKLEAGWGRKFYEEIFINIDEKIFEPMYSKVKSRPNFPVNIMISLLILKMKFNYSDEELFEQYNYNIMFRYALGLKDFEQYYDISRTYYNFKKRLLEYKEKTGEDLLKKMFNELNKKISMKYNISNKEERLDSTLIWSNIKSMSRLELCIETFKKFYKKLKIERYEKEIEKYIGSDSENYCYKLKKEEFNKELEDIGVIIYRYYKKYLNNSEVNKLAEFKTLENLLYQQFNIVEDMEIVEPKDSKDIKSYFIQSPHDPEATYRKKGKIESKGYCTTLIETADTENIFNIVTDVDVSQNIESDGKILESKIEELKRNDVKTIYADGGYDEQQVAKVAKENDINLILTGFKGQERGNNKIKLSDFEIKEDSIIKCPYGYEPVGTKEYPNSIKVIFAKSACEHCEKKDICLIKKGKSNYYMKVKKSYLRKINILKSLNDNIKNKAWKNRAISESSMKQIKTCCYKDKIRFRGKENIRIIIIFRAIAINFGRILTYFEKAYERSAFIVKENYKNFENNCYLGDNVSIYKKIILFLKNLTSFYNNFLKSLFLITMNKKNIIFEI